MKLRLKKPAIQYKQTFCDYVEDYIKAKEVFYADYYNDALVDFDKFIKRLKSEESVITKGRGEPYNTFWFIDSEEKIVGISRLRSKLNQWIEQSIGHIGFDVRPAERRKGHANQILDLTVKEAKKLGHEKLLLICDSDNVASKKVIETNGGKLIGEITSLLSGNQALKFEIK